MSLKNAQIEDSFTSTDEDVKILMFHVLNLSLRHDSNEKQIISAINRFLSTSSTRSQGLEYLNLIINNCSSEGISLNALTWINNCLAKQHNDILKEQKLSITRKIIRNAYHNQDFSKKFLLDYMAKIIEMCLSKHANPNETEVALDTLTVCMITYSSWFTTHKVRIGTYVERFLDSSSQKLVQRAAMAFHHLQQIGNAGMNGINLERNFASAVTKLCATLHSLYDTLFENETELENYDKLDDAFTFTALPYASEKMLHITTRRIVNCLKFLKVMLLTGFPAPKNIKPKQILDVIGRGLALHLCVTSSEERSFQDFQFSLLLTRIQIQLLQLLKAFIIWSQSNLLPFSYVVSKILIDSLNRCQKCACFSTNCIYHETVYKVLSCWIHIVKTLPVRYQEQLVLCILNDITPDKEKVSLNIAVESDSSKSKKGRRKEKIAANCQSTGSIVKTTNKKEFEENKCIFALKTMSDLLFSTPLGLNVELLKKLYSVIIGTVLDVNTSKEVHPYTNPKCQEKLYDVLVAFYEQDTLQVFPPLQLTIQVLNMGANNPNRNISLTCEKGLSMLEKLCQSVRPSAEASVEEISRQPQPPTMRNSQSNADETVEDGSISVVGSINVLEDNDEEENEEQPRNSEVWSETTELLDDNSFEAEHYQAELERPRTPGESNSFEAEHYQAELERPRTPEPLQERSQNKIVILNNEIVNPENVEVPVAETTSSNADEETELTKIIEIHNDGPPAKKVKLEEPVDVDDVKKEASSFEESVSDIYVGFVDVVKNY